MLTFLKLGGSLITDKMQPHTPRHEVIHRLAKEIALAKKEAEGLEILLGHGSGSFGHVPAKRWGTRQGVHSPEQWQGFLEVWREAEALNRIIMDALEDAGLLAISCAPHASVISREGKVVGWDLRPISMALEAGLIPVVYGDVIFDDKIGGTILSTEDLFNYLAVALQPGRILLAGIEPGVWSDYPVCSQLIETITPINLVDVENTLTGSAATDVTGGMASKVRESLDLAQKLPGLEAVIFSGEKPDLLRKVLLGEIAGTLIKG
jgi:isopentenyl phosphate kinase